MFYHQVFHSNDQKHYRNLSWKPTCLPILSKVQLKWKTHMLISFLYLYHVSVESLAKKNNSHAHIISLYHVCSLKIDIGLIGIFWIDAGQWWQDVCSVHIMRIVIPKSSGHQLLYSSFINKPTSFNWHKFTFKIIFVAFTLILIGFRNIFRIFLRYLEGCLKDSW